MRIVRFLASLTSIAAGEWAYTWPYKTDGSCKCQKTSVGDVFHFDSEEECLLSFAQEEAEYCTFRGEGITDHECENAVSVLESVDNSRCQNHCLDLIIGNIVLEEFLQSCRFEPVINFPEAAVPIPGGCFTNYVLGNADYDPSKGDDGAPLKILHQVDGPARCQHLCQITKSCVWFSWRGACDVVGTLPGFQNPVGTCLLYDNEYVRGVFDVDISGLRSSPYCDKESYKNVCDAPTNVFRPFAGLNCLLCDCEPHCVWKSEKHIGGPVYCSTHATDVCNIKPDEWFTTTSTEPACPEVTCPECVTEGEGTSTTTEGSTTTGIDIETDTTTTKATTTAPECPPCEEGDDDCNDRDSYWEPEDLE